jgi:glycosyltransferase involved in cell wall biosynthesis
VGLIRPRKNITTLLSAVRQAHALWRERFTLVMAGPRDSRFIDVAREARALGIPGMVVQTGVIPDEELRVLYKHASMVVLPSLVEGFGFPILEGMASGTPVIASDIPVHREVAGDAALLVPPRDVDAWGDALVRVFSDPEFARGLSARGMERVKAFSLNATARRTLAVYEDLLGA